LPIKEKRDLKGTLSEVSESDLMKLIKGYSARAINIMRDMEGPLWQARFHRSIITGERFFFEQKIKYIEENPVRAGLCLRPEDWPWSSVRYQEIMKKR